MRAGYFLFGAELMRVALQRRGTTQAISSLSTIPHYCFTNARSVIIHLTEFWFSDPLDSCANHPAPKEVLELLREAEAYG